MARSLRSWPPASSTSWLPAAARLSRLAGKAIEAAGETAGEMAEDQFQRQLLDRLGQSEAELTRLGQLLEYLTGPLVKVCDKAAAFADQADDLPDIIGRAIAADPSLAPGAAPDREH
jgi:hypothetical protein